MATDTQDGENQESGSPSQSSTELPRHPVELGQLFKWYTPEDIHFHWTLQRFLVQRKSDPRPDNLHSMVTQWRGSHVAHFWAWQSAVYGVSEPECVELLEKSLYLSAAVEYPEQNVQAELEESLERVAEIRSQCSSRQWPAPMNHLELLNKVLQAGNVSLLRMLTFRGLPSHYAHRAKVWKILLSYEPTNAAQNAIYREKIRLYRSSRRDLLNFGPDHDTSVNVRSDRYKVGDEDLLHQIKEDVHGTCPYAEQAALAILLFIYAKLNPSLGYLPGMHSIAAFLLHTFLAETDPELDTFWCFAAIMQDIQDNFLSSEGISDIYRLLTRYDAELARHLSSTAFDSVLRRWVTAFFTEEEGTATDLFRLWDSLIADPVPYGFLTHFVVSVLLHKRAELLATEQSELGEFSLRMEDFLQVRSKAFAICAYTRAMSTNHRCANPACEYKVTDPVEFGGFCCKRCHSTWERGTEVTHGCLCDRVVGNSKWPRARPTPPREPFGAGSRKRRNKRWCSQTKHTEEGAS